MGTHSALATRYEKRAASRPAMVVLASIVLWLQSGCVRQALVAGEGLTWRSLHVWRGQAMHAERQEQLTAMVQVVLRTPHRIRWRV